MNLTLSKLPWYAQVGAFVGLAAAGVGAFFYYYEMPVRAELAIRDSQLKSLHRDIAKGLATERQLPEFQAQVDDLEGRLANLRAVLPEQKDAADLLRRLQTLATQSNLVITSFKPAAVVAKQLHEEWPINLELSGTYHNLAIFFDRLGKFARIVNISGLDVKGKERDKQESGATIAATCTATTFVLLDKPNPAKGAAKPATPAAPPATGKKA